jgi:hypothetical protein
MPDKLGPGFRAFAISQIRLSVFVGHDSLAQIQEENDKVFGKELTTIPSILQSRPHLTIDLPYMTAVVREPLRLFAP